MLKHFFVLLPGPEVRIRREIGRFKISPEPPVNYTDRNLRPLRSATPSSGSYTPSSGLPPLPKMLVTTLFAHRWALHLTFLVVIFLFILPTSTTGRAILQKRSPPTENDREDSNTLPSNARGQSEELFTPLATDASPLIGQALPHAPPDNYDGISNSPPGPNRRHGLYIPVYHRCHPGYKELEKITTATMRKENPLSDPVSAASHRRHPSFENVQEAPPSSSNPDNPVTYLAGAASKSNLEPKKKTRTRIGPNNDEQKKKWVEAERKFKNLPLPPIPGTNDESPRDIKG